MKDQVKQLHQLLVKMGEYKVARKVLRFLQTGIVVCWLDDVSWKTANVLSAVGLEGRVSSQGEKETFYLERK